MYAGASSEFNTEMDKNGGRTFAAAIEVGGKTITDGIKSIKLTDATSSGETLEIGSTIIKQAEIFMKKPDVVLENAIITVKIGLVLDSGIEYIPMGVYKVTKPEEQSGWLTVKAYGRMYDLDRLYASSLTYPVTSDKILEEISKKTGVTFNVTQNPIKITKAPAGYTCREVVGFLAGLYGTSAVENRSGAIEFRWYPKTATVKDIGLGKTYEFKKDSQADYSLDKISCVVSTDKEVTAGSGVRQVEMQNPYMTQARIDSIYETRKAFSYRPGTVSFLGDIRLDPWDVVTVTDLSGTYRMPVMVLDTEYDGGVKSEITAPADTEAETSDFRGPMQLSLDRAYTEILAVNALLADKVTADWVKANTITADQLEATNAKISQLEADTVKTSDLIAVKAEITEAVVESIDAKYADIELANVETASIGKLFAKVGLLNSATIVDGHVTGYLDAVNVNADSITAGTLSVDRLVIRGSSESIIYEINSITGALQAVNADTINGEVLTPRTINADRIIASSITTTELAAACITADKIAADAITADKIQANAVTAAKINVSNLAAITANLGTVTAGVIQSSNYVAETTGMKLNLTDGSWDSKYTKIDKTGKISCSNIAITDGSISIKAGSKDGKTLITIQNDYLGDDQITVRELTKYSQNRIAFYLYDSGVVNSTTVSLREQAIVDHNMMYLQYVPSPTDDDQTTRYIKITASAVTTNGTINGYTLAGACARAVTGSVTSGSTDLITSGGVYTALKGNLSPSKDNAYQLGSNDYNYSSVKTREVKSNSQLKIISGANLSLYSASNAAAAFIHAQDLRVVSYSSGEGSSITYAVCYAKSFSQQSSKRYKDYIRDITESDAGAILNLNPVIYNYKNPENGKNCEGLFAEDVDKLIPYAVSYDQYGRPDGLDYSKLVPRLIRLVQMQERRIRELELKGATEC